MQRDIEYAIRLREKEIAEHGSKIYERTLNSEDDVEHLKQENKKLRRELETERSLNHQLQKLLFE